MSQERKIIMPFIDQSQNFTNGFECGQIWERMERGEKFDKYLMHPDNQLQVEMMCKRFLYKGTIEISGEWAFLTAEIDLSKTN